MAECFMSLALVFMIHSGMASYWWNKQIVPEEKLNLFAEIQLRLIKELL